MTPVEYFKSLMGADFAEIQRPSVDEGLKVKEGMDSVGKKDKVMIPIVQMTPPSKDDLGYSSNSASNSDGKNPTVMTPTGKGIECETPQAPNKNVRMDTLNTVGSDEKSEVVHCKRSAPGP